MRFGFTARRSSTSTLSLVRAWGRKLVRKTSAVATILSNSSCPSSDLRSSPTLRFPRLGSSIMWLTPPGPDGTRPEVTKPRCGSPVSGCSILMTSAPHSARTAPAIGTYVQAATSTTRMPFMMGFTVLLSFTSAG